MNWAVAAIVLTAVWAASAEWRAYEDHMALCGSFDIIQCQGERILALEQLSGTLDTSGATIAPDVRHDEPRCKGIESLGQTWQYEEDTHPCLRRGYWRD